MPATSSHDIIEKPVISSGIDLPFPPNSASPEQPSEDIPTQIRLNDQKHTHAVEDFKNAIGKQLLYGCLIAIAMFALLDAHYNIESPMFTSAFEVAKIVATTVLGYLFGSKSKS